MEIEEEHFPAVADAEEAMVDVVDVVDVDAADDVVNNHAPRRNLVPEGDPVIRVLFPEGEEAEQVPQPEAEQVHQPEAEQVHQPEAVVAAPVP